ncbi:hypothetical protein GCM10027168_66930 [Streptomyces capparidis]
MPADSTRRPAGSLSLRESDLTGGSPQALAEISATARKTLDEFGYVYLCDVPAEFDHPSFLSGFGEFMPQYDGKLVWDLTPEPDMDDVYHSRNTRALVPHTEAYEYPGPPPRYLALWCVRPAQGPGGETTLADGREWLGTFTTEELDHMRTHPYEWHSSEGLARKDIHLSNRHPILSEHRGHTVLRYSANNVEDVDDGFLPGYVQRGVEFFDKTHIAVRIERNALLVWDNWRMLHSRTAFKDRGRHLKRVLIAA